MSPYHSFGPSVTGSCFHRDLMLKRAMLKMFAVIPLILLCLYPFSFSFGFETKGQDCSRCHTLTSAEARELLKDIPNIRILDVYMSPVKSFWEVYLESGGKKGLIYVDFSKKYFISGSLLSVREKKNLTQERLTELNRVDVSQIPLEDALVMGDPAAKIRMIAFDDPD
jgi:thiol:disulfide interchange protein DsbC